MTRTNWSRCSRLVLAALVVLSALAVPAAAVSVAETDVPDEAQVGTQVTASVTVDELYNSPEYQQWQLAGSTELTNVTWTVTWFNQAGNQMKQQSYDGQNFSGAAVNIEEGHDSVQVSVTGTVPAVENYTYDPAPTFLVMELRQERQGGTSSVIDEWEARHFTEESQAARDALDQAALAIEEAGNPEQAETTFENAVQAYEGEQFDLATNLAGEAEQQATKKQESQETTQLLLYVGVGIGVLALIVGGFLYWRSQQDTYDKLG